jgi:hypothetical protein
MRTLSGALVDNGLQRTRPRFDRVAQYRSAVIVDVFVSGKYFGVFLIDAAQ